MKKISLTLLTILMIAIAFAVQSFRSTQRKTDFSGTWNINMGKSSFGQAPTYTASKQIKIDQAVDKITLEKHGQGYTQPDTITYDTMTFDGKDTQVNTSQKQKKSYKVVWSNNDQTLTQYVTCSVSDGDEEYYKGTDQFELTDGGKTLVVKRTVEFATGFKYEIKAVYSK